MFTPPLSPRSPRDEFVIHQAPTPDGPKSVKKTSTGNGSAARQLIFIPQAARPAQLAPPAQQVQVRAQQARPARAERPQENAHPDSFSALQRAFLNAQRQLPRPGNSSAAGSARLASASVRHFR